MVHNELTLGEAYAIHRCWFFGGHVTDCLHQRALAIIHASKPAVILAPINWYEDDGSDATFERDAAERADELASAERYSEEWKHR